MTDYRSEWQNSTQILGICTRGCARFSYDDFKRKSVALSGGFKHCRHSGGGPWDL